MTLSGRLSTAANMALTAFGARLWTAPNAPMWQALPHTVLYAILRNYYWSNNLYENIGYALRQQGIATPAIKPLRNPTYRVVEFYASKIWPGTLDEALTIEADNAAIIPAIQQVWKWSNWGSQKQHAIRTLAITGDWFVKVVTRTDAAGQVQRVYFQTIEPEYVTDFTEDERGYITRIRVDISPYTDPAMPLEPNRQRVLTRTEEWDKDANRYRCWVHEKGPDEELDRLGTPREDAPLTSLGIDFVPFCHAMLRDVGQPRGMAAILPAKDKIDEANMQATRLHQMLYRHNKAFWALTAGGLDASGRPLPPVQVQRNGSTPTTTMELGDDEIMALPGAAQLQPLVPNINYDAALNVLNAMMDEIEHDLPELAYYSLRTQGEVSGVAVRLLLSDAIDRLEEARGNAYAALIQADEMALTIAASNGLPGFEALGTFEAGDFDHTLTGRPVIPDDVADPLQALQVENAQLLADSRRQLIGQREEGRSRGRQTQEIDAARSPTETQ